MDNTFPSWVIFLIPIAGILGGVSLAGLGIYAGIRRREFEHRERLAMIEKGVAPPVAAATPESDGVLPTHADVWHGSEDREARLRRGGFILMAIGFGIGFMIWTTSHEPGAAMGVGGFLMILGAAIFLSSYFGRGSGGGTTTTPGASRR